MNKLKIFIITEGGKGIGFGHIVRCASMADAFRKRGMAAHFIVNADVSALPMLKGQRFKRFNWLKNKKKLFSYVKNADITIVDSYLADRTFYARISKLVKRPVYLDDNKRLKYPRGTVINPSVYAANLGYPRKADLDYILGPKYTYLRKEFGSCAEKVVNDRVKNIMITFGGDDKRNMTPGILRFLKSECPDARKSAIVSDGFRNLKEIEPLKGKNVKIINNPSTGELRDIMIASDVAITACGQTLQELARIGTPSVGISIAENQLQNAKGWKETGFLKYIGDYDDAAIFMKLGKALSDLKPKKVRLSMSRAGMRLVDGKGSMRIIREILAGYCKNGFRVRKAGPGDARNIFNLSNEDAVRKNSFNPKKFGWRHHIKWF